MFSSRRIAEAGMIAACYTVLTLFFLPLSFGPIQLRFSEMLTVLPAFVPSALWGVTLGCFISNILGGAVLPDIVFGTLATFIGAILTMILTKKSSGAVLSGNAPANLSFRLRTVLAPIISNTLIVPLVLKYAYAYDEALYFMAFTVCIGEILGIGVLGNILMSVLLRTGIMRKFSEN